MIYFDNSATSSYKPPEVVRAVADTLTNLSANPGRSGHRKAAEAAQLVESARVKLMRFFGLRKDGSAVFCYNCTQALNYALSGLKELGHFVTTAYEHNSVLRPLHRLNKSGAAYYTVVPPRSDGLINAADIIKAVNLNTVMIIVNHISNVNGSPAPIAEIGEFCRYRNILLLVDGAQSGGHIDIDMERDNIDMLAVAPHKGLHAPQGLGALLVRGNISLTPMFVGGTGSMSTSPDQPETLPDGLESGTQATPSIAGLSAALDWVKDNFDKRNKRLQEFSSALYYGLRSKNYITHYTPELCCTNGVISFNIKGLDSNTAADLLNEHFDIAVRAGLHCAPLAHKFLGTQSTGTVRASLSADNTPDEIAAFLLAIDTIYTKTR